MTTYGYARVSTNGQDLSSKANAHDTRWFDSVAWPNLSAS